MGVINRLASLLIVSSLMMLMPVSSQAQQVLKSSRKPIDMMVKTPLDASTAQAGDSFEIALTESYSYKGHTIPEGTVLSGKVVKAEPSQRYLRPGFVRLEISEAVFPSGERKTFENLETKNIMNEDSVSVKRFLSSAIPFTLVSAADSIPLKYAANWSTWEILPVSFGARMILGMILEHTPREKRKHDKKDDGWGKRYAHGAFRGTGIPGIISIFRKYPNPELAQGSTFPLKLKKKQMVMLFEAAP